MDAVKLRATIKDAEGLRLTPYADNGRISIGFGHNLTANGISEAIAEWLLNDDLIDAQRGITAGWPTFETLDDVRQRAVIELAFNVGVQGALMFRKMLHALAVKDWGTASQELLNSQAALSLPSRYHRLALMIETGDDV